MSSMIGVVHPARDHDHKTVEICRYLALFYFSVKLIITFTFDCEDTDQTRVTVTVNGKTVLVCPNGNFPK